MRKCRDGTGSSSRGRLCSLLQASLVRQAHGSASGRLPGSSSAGISTVDARSASCSEKSGKLMVPLGPFLWDGLVLGGAFLGRGLCAFVPLGDRFGVSFAFSFPGPSQPVPMEGPVSFCPFP